MKAALKLIAADLATIHFAYRTFRSFGNGRAASLEKALIAVADRSAVDLFPEGEDPGLAFPGAPKAKLVVMNKRDMGTVN